MLWSPEVLRRGPLALETPTGRRTSGRCVVPAQSLSKASPDFFFTGAVFLVVGGRFGVSPPPGFSFFTPHSRPSLPLLQFFNSSSSFPHLVSNSPSVYIFPSVPVSYLYYLYLYIYLALRHIIQRRLDHIHTRGAASYTIWLPALIPHPNKTEVQDDIFWSCVWTTQQQLEQRIDTTTRIS